MLNSAKLQCSQSEMAEKLSPALKPIQPFLVIAKQFVKRDPVVAYYGEDLSSHFVYMKLFTIDLQHSEHVCYAGRYTYG